MTHGERQLSRQEMPTVRTVPRRPAPRNPLAVVAVVLVVVCAPLGVVLGLVARRQTARRGERGRALATTGIVAGAVVTVLEALIALAAASGAVSFHTYAGPFLSGSQVAAGITGQSEGHVQDVGCPDDLDGQVGATTTCTATVDGRPGTVRATTTSVDGGEIRFSFDQVG